MELLIINSRKMPVEDRWMIILQNNSKCLLLNDKQMSHEIQFNLIDEIQNTRKLNIRESEKSKEKIVTLIGWVVLVFAFLSSTVEVGRWKKLNEIFVFGISFSCYVWLRLLWNDLKFSRIRLQHLTDRFLLIFINIE